MSEQEESNHIERYVDAEFMAVLSKINVLLTGLGAGWGKRCLNRVGSEMDCEKCENCRISDVLMLLPRLLDLYKNGIKDNDFDHLYKVIR